MTDDSLPLACIYMTACISRGLTNLTANVTLLSVTKYVPFKGKETENQCTP